MKHPSLRQRGFTLIELIAVMALISITFYFAVPRFSGTVMDGNIKQSARWLMMNIKSLKEASSKNRTRFILNIDVDTNTMWVTNEQMKDEDVLKSVQNGYETPDDVRVMDVAFPEQGTISSGTAQICFYRKGYSDKAIIHLEDSDGTRFSLLVEPFLPEVKLYETYESFE